MLGGTLEFIVLLVAAAYLALNLTPKITELQMMTNGNTAAWEQRVIWSGAKGYLQQNFTTVYNQAAGGPISISLLTLQNGGFLPSNFGGPNPWQQTPVIVVAQTGVANQLFGYVATIGGNPIPVAYLGNIAKLTADYGAYVPYSTEPNTCAPAPCAKVVGGFGAIPMTAFASLGAIPTAGHLVNGLFFSAGQEIAPYLYRLPGGDPDDNTMHQDINMNAYNILDAKTVAATTQMTSPIYADSANPSGYYLKPAGQSVLQDVQLRNETATGTLSVTGAVTANSTLTAAGSITAPAYLYPP